MVIVRLFFTLTYILFLIVFSCRDCKAEFVEFECPSWGTGYYSGYRTPCRGVIIEEGEWKAVWNKHATIDPTPTPLPLIDFDNYMVVVNFRGNYDTSGYHIRFFSIYYNSFTGALTFFYWVNYWIPPWLMTRPDFTQPFEMIIVPKNVRCEYRFVEVVWNYFYHWWKFI